MKTSIRPLVFLSLVLVFSALYAVTHLRVRSDAGVRPDKVNPQPPPQNPGAWVIDPLDPSGNLQQALSVCCTPGGWTLTLSPSTGVTDVTWQESSDLDVPFTPIAGATGITANINPDVSLCSSPGPVKFYYRAIFTNQFISGFTNIVSVTVFPTPKGGPLTASPSSICDDKHSTSTICLAGPVTGTVTWTDCNGTPLSPQPTGLCFNVGPGTPYPFSLTTCYHAAITSGPCLPLPLSTSVTLVPMPEKGTITAIPPMCVGDAATLNVIGAMGNVAWYSAVPSGSFPCQCPPTSSFTPMGLTGVTVNTNKLSHTICYQVQVSDPNGVCPPVTSASVLVTVQLPPTKPSIIGPPYICCGGTATINLTPGPISAGCDPTPAITYQLINLSTGTSVPANPGPNVVMSPGNYQVEASNICGKAPSNIITIKPDQLAVTISGPCCDCKAKPVTLTANPIPGVGPYTYLWTTPAGPVGTTQSVTVTPTVTTIYTVAVTDANGCTASASFTVTVCN